MMNRTTVTRQKEQTQQSSKDTISSVESGSLSLERTHSNDTQDIHLPTAKDRILVNEVAAVVHGPERSAVFSTLSYKRHGIDGRQRSLTDLIVDELIYQDALRIKMPVDDAVVKAHLRKVLQSFGLKPGDEESIFAQEGYSYDEGFEEFRTMYAVNAMIEHQVVQNIFVSDEEVVAYYNAHPIVKEPAVLLQTAAIPFKTASEEDKAKAMERAQRFIKTGVDTQLAWSSGHWVKKSELAPQLHVFLTKEVGFVLPVESSQELFLYRLLNKKEERVVPLAKRYKKITEILRRPKYEEMVADYKKRLINNATVIYLQQ
jgi:hypothetical protein